MACTIRLLSACISFSVAIHSSSASVVTPSRSLRALSGRQVWVPICSRRGVNGSSAWFDNVNTTVMDQTACYSPAYGSVSAMKIVFSAFDMPQQGEADRPIVATGTAAVYAPLSNTNVVISYGSVSVGSTTLNFSSTALGANSISIGQVVSSSGGGVAASTYVTGVTNSFVAGAGNSPTTTVVSLSAPTTASTAAGQPFTFAGTITPAKFGGRRQFTIEPAHDVVISDAVAVQMPPSSLFYVRVSASMSGPGMQLMDYPGSGSRLAGEFDSRGLLGNDQTLFPTSLSNTGGGYWAPTMVLGLVSLPAGQPSPGAILILGDSIAAGTGDTADAYGLQGYIQRSLENYLPYVTAARGSTTAFALAAHGDGQYALSVDSGITDVLLEDGRNDLLSFQASDVALEASIAQIAGRYIAAGKRVWCFTVPPTTQSNDGWISLSDQSWTVAVNTTGASVTSAGSFTLSMQSVANLTSAQAVSAIGIAAGSVITNISGFNVTLSAATTATLPGGTRLSFGSSNPAQSASETYRRSYNSFLRQHNASLGCSGLIDIDSVVADQAGSGKWRVDLGAASLDGVHPSAALHQAAVNAGLLSPNMFQPQ